MKLKYLNSDETQTLKFVMKLKNSNKDDTKKK